MLRAATAPLSCFRSALLASLLIQVGCSYSPPPRLSLLPILVDSIPWSPVALAIAEREQREAELRAMAYRTGSVAARKARVMLDTIAVHDSAFKEAYGVAPGTAARLLESWHQVAGQVLALQGRDHGWSRGEAGRKLLTQEAELYSQYCSRIRDPVLCHSGNDQ